MWIERAENQFNGVFIPLMDEPSEGRYCNAECVGLVDVLSGWFRGEMLFTLLQKTLAPRSLPSE